MKKLKFYSICKSQVSLPSLMDSGEKHEYIRSEIKELLVTEMLIAKVSAFLQLS